MRSNLDNDITQQDVDKEVVCSYLPSFQKEFPQKYHTLQQLLTKSSQSGSITRSRSNSLPSNSSNVEIIQKQLAILEVVACAFKKSAQEAGENNKVQKRQMKQAKIQNKLLLQQNKMLEESNTMVKKQNGWDRRITISCGVVNVLLAFATLGLGITTAYLSSVKAIE